MCIRDRQRTGADIPWIFEIEGEDGFRDREARVIDDLTQRDRIVVATGGGAVLRPENRACLSERGFVVYLDASLREQVRRTGRDDKRPLLAGQDRRAVLADLMAVREPLYTETADLRPPRLDAMPGSWPRILLPPWTQLPRTLELRRPTP